MGQFLAWHPSVHSASGRSLAFFLIRVTTFRRTEVFEEIKEVLRQREYGAYRIYQVLGHSDVILRVWLPEKDLLSASFSERLKKGLTGSPEVESFGVTDIPHH